MRASGAGSGQRVASSLRWRSCSSASVISILNGWGAVAVVMLTTLEGNRGRIRSSIAARLCCVWQTSTRLLQLLAMLQARRDWSGQDLASRLEVSARTVRTDIERLRELGYPVEATPGVGGGYRLGHGTTMPPLLLDEEVVAVAVALRTTAGAGVTGIEEASYVRSSSSSSCYPPGCAIE